MDYTDFALPTSPIPYISDDRDDWPGGGAPSSPIPYITADSYWHDYSSPHADGIPYIVDDGDHDEEGKKDGEDHGENDEGSPTGAVNAAGTEDGGKDFGDGAKWNGGENARGGADVVSQGEPEGGAPGGSSPTDSPTLEGDRKQAGDGDGSGDDGSVTPPSDGEVAPGSEGPALGSGELQESGHSVNDGNRSEDFDKAASCQMRDEGDEEKWEEERAEVGLAGGASVLATGLAGQFVELPKLRVRVRADVGATWPVGGPHVASGGSQSKGEGGSVAGSDVECDNVADKDRDAVLEEVDAWTSAGAEADVVDGDESDIPVSEAEGDGGISDGKGMASPSLGVDGREGLCGDASSSGDWGEDGQGGEEGGPEQEKEKEGGGDGSAAEEKAEECHRDDDGDAGDDDWSEKDGVEVADEADGAGGEVLRSAQSGPHREDNQGDEEGKDDQSGVEGEEEGPREQLEEDERGKEEEEGEGAEEEGEQEEEEEGEKGTLEEGQGEEELSHPGVRGFSLPVVHSMRGLALPVTDASVARGSPLVCEPPSRSVAAGDEPGEEVKAVETGSDDGRGSEGSHSQTSQRSGLHSPPGVAQGAADGHADGAILARGGDSWPGAARDGAEGGHGDGGDGEYSDGGEEEMRGDVQEDQVAQAGSEDDGREMSQGEEGDGGQSQGIRPPLGTRDMNAFSHGGGLLAQQAVEDREHAEEEGEERGKGDEGGDGLPPPRMHGVGHPPFSLMQREGKRPAGVGGPSGADAINSGSDKENELTGVQRPLGLAPVSTAQAASGSLTMRSFGTKRSATASMVAQRRQQQRDRSEHAGRGGRTGEDAPQGGVTAGEGGRRLSARFCLSFSILEGDANSGAGRRGGEGNGGYGGGAASDLRDGSQCNEGVHRLLCLDVLQGTLRVIDDEGACTLACHMAELELEPALPVPPSLGRASYGQPRAMGGDGDLGGDQRDSTWCTLRWQGRKQRCCFQSPWEKQCFETGIRCHRDESWRLPRMYQQTILMSATMECCIVPQSQLRRCFVVLTDVRLYQFASRTSVYPKRVTWLLGASVHAIKERPVDPGGICVGRARDAGHYISVHMAAPADISSARWGKRSQASVTLKLASEGQASLWFQALQGCAGGAAVSNTQDLAG